MAGKRKGEKLAGLPVSIGMGTLVSVVITLLGAALTAYLVSTEKIGEGSMEMGAWIVTALASILGAWTAVAMVKKGRMQTAALTGLAYFLVLLSMTALFFGGQYHGIGVSALIVFLCVGATGLLSARTKTTGKRGHRKRLYR